MQRIDGRIVQGRIVKGRIVRRAALVAAVMAAAGAWRAPEARAAEPTWSYTDSDFAPTDWEQSFRTYDATGDAGLAQRPAQPSGTYQEVRLFGNVFSFQICTAAVYDPATLGAIRELDHFEMARTVGRLHRVAPALRQNGKLYAAYSNSNDTTDYLEPVFSTANNPDFEPITFFGLRDVHFRTLENQNDHPDFSASGAPIEFGYARAFSPAVEAVGDIDDWTVTINPALRLALTEEIRAEAHATIAVEPGSGFSDIFYSDVRARPPRTPADQVAVVSYGIEGDEIVPGVTYGRASFVSGLGARSDALIPEEVQRYVDSIHTRTRASHRRKLVAQWEGPGPAPANVPMDLVMFGHGTLRLRALLVNDPGPTPLSTELYALGRAQVVVSTIAGGSGVSESTVFDEFIRLDHSGVSTTARWQDAHSQATGDDGKPVTELQYFEVLNDAFTVPFSEEFAVEFVLETEAWSQDSAPQRYAQADFANTLSFDVTTDTPGVRLIEVLAEAGSTDAPVAVAGKRKLKIGKLARRKGKDEAQLTFGDGVWAVEDADHVTLGGTYEITDPKGRKITLTLDDASREALLENLSLAASDGAGARVEVLLDEGKAPKLQASLNGKRTKLKLKAKLKLVATTVDGTVVKGSYTLSAKGEPPPGLVPAE